MKLVYDRCSFRYGRRGDWAVQDVSLVLHTGRTILLGPNGAGKSTFMALGATAVEPTAGAVRVTAPAGRRADRREHRRAVGWMPQRIDAVRGLSVREQVAVAGWLKGLSRTEAWDRSRAALDAVGLTALGRRPSHRLSGGQRARMGLAQALVHEASVMLLDEPAAALDPAQRSAFLDLLGELADDRVIVVSTHDVNELASAFDRVVILNTGRIAFDGSVEQFLGRGGQAQRPVDAYRALLGSPS